MEKKQTDNEPIDLFVVRNKKQRSRQSVITQTWAMLASVQYTDEDYDAWFMELGIEDIEVEKEVIAAAVRNVQAVQTRFYQECERRRLRRMK